MSSNIPDLPKSSGRFSSKAKKKRGSNLSTRDLQGLATGAQRVLQQDENITHLDPNSPIKVLFLKLRCTHVKDVTKNFNFFKVKKKN